MMYATWLWCNSLSKEQTFCNTTTGFPGKWQQRKVQKFHTDDSSGHYPDLGSQRACSQARGEKKNIFLSFRHFPTLTFCYCLLHWLRASQVARTKYYNTTCIINQDNDNLGNKFHGCFPDDSATKVQSNPHPTLKCGQKSQQIPRYPSVCPQGLIHISKFHLKSIMFQRYFWLAYAHVNFLKW